MCGIGGYVCKENSVSEQVLNAMASKLQHRGPDDQGIYLSPNQQVGLLHRRLSFLDLSAAGKQPMINPDGSLVVSLNGEIYNFIELRQELQRQGCVFSTQTDTEVLLHGYKVWGMQLPEKLKGMFAFVLFDLASNRLMLVRDRFGIKPLYYGVFDGSFGFASELKALLLVPNAKRNIRKASVATFLANRYVPCPHTIWENMYKLPPATVLTYDCVSHTFSTQPYWKLRTHTLRLSEPEVTQRVEELLAGSVEEHLRSDVPIGSFLSGGMDSTALVMKMKAVSKHPDVFVIGFTNWSESEHHYAKLAADALGATLTTAMLDTLEMESVKSLMHWYDEPIADISILPTFEVSKLAASKVKAVLSGEGADECFGGYWWQQPEKFQFTSPLSKWLSTFTGTGFSQIKQHYVQAMSMGLFDHALLSEVLAGEWKEAVPRDVFSHFDSFEQSGVSVLRQIQLLDIHTFMAELILTKVDRASMANSLEVRVPFLDHQLVEFMFQLDETSFFRAGSSKQILRNILKGHVPEVIYNRPKQGFVGPDVFYADIGLYQRFLENGALIQHHVIEPKGLNQLIQNRRHWHLWKLFVLECWWQTWMNNE